MYPVAITAVVLWLISIVAGQTTQNLDLLHAYRQTDQQNSMVMVSDSLQQYFNSTDGFPLSLAALSQTPGYEQTRSLLNVWQGYAVSPALTDSMWTFNRMVAFTNDTPLGVNATAYLASNGCGSGSFSTATGWCGAKTSLWFRLETRGAYTDAIYTQRSRFNWMMQRLTDYYSANNAFPSVNATNQPLTPNTTYTLQSLAGFSGTVATCTGQFTWAGLPVDCADMFDRWGNAVGLEFFSNQHVTLISQTPIYNAAGTEIVVATDFDVIP